MKIGDFYTETILFTQSQVDHFGKLTGDLNPVHYEDTAAIKLGFKGKIIHGFLSGSVFSKIIGMKFPGNGSIYLSQSLKFKRPIYTDISYKVHIEILDIIEEKKRLLLKTQLLDINNNETLLDGEALVYFNQLIT